MGNFAGGVIPLRLQGINKEGEICIFDFEIKLPPCKIEILDKKTDTTTTIGAIELGLSPNPAHESVGIRYKGLGSQGTLSLYDLIGHRLTEIPLNGNDGEMELSIKGYATGVYIVVVKTNDGLLYQQKLIIE